MARGGSQRIAEALAKIIVDGGGSIETGRMVSSLDQLPTSHAVVLDVMPRAAVRIGGNRVSPRDRRRLTGWKVGPAVFKVDWALDGPIPWADESSPLAGTVHVGGTWEEVVEAEDQVHAGSHPERPLVLVSRNSRDSTLPEPRRGNTPPGAIATSRRAPMWT